MIARWRGRIREEGGFTLVEMSVALILSAMVVGTSYPSGSIATCSSGVLSVESGTISLRSKYQRSSSVASSV